jgi:hypothetical protein
MMENNENRIITILAVGKEYQIPELVDLSIVSEAKASCGSGSGDSTCAVGTGAGYN